MYIYKHKYSYIYMYILSFRADVIYLSKPCPKKHTLPHTLRYIYIYKYTHTYIYMHTLIHIRTYSFSVEMSYTSRACTLSRQKVSHSFPLGMTVSTEIATPPKSTKSRNSDFSVSRGINSNRNFV